MVDARFDLDQYHYTFRAPDGTVLWRIDKHPGHPHLSHIHFGGARAAAYYHEETELDEVLARVQDWMSQFA